MEAVVERSGTDWATMSDLFVQMERVWKRVFGCWHVDMSLPFSRDNETYRTCVACGARRRFDLERWAMVGPYYHPERQLALYARTS